MISPFDDLLPVDYVTISPLDDSYESVKVGKLGTCTRCGGVVADQAEAREGHKLWHRAVESAGASAPTQTEQPPAEFQPLREQLIGRLLEGPTFRDEAECVDWLSPVIEAWCEKYLSRATTAEALTEQLRAQLEQEIGHLDRCNERHAGLSRGETDRLRRVEDALVELGAPGSSTRDDPAGPMIAWIRDKVEQLKGADQREAALIEANHQLFQRPTQDVYARAIAAALDKRHAELLDAMGIVEPIGFYDALDVVRAWHGAKLDAHRGTAANTHPVSPTVAGIIDAQHVALLRLAAKGRHAYAEGRSESHDELGKLLRYEAKAFEAAARLIEDPRRLAGLIPTSMQTWSLDDDVSEIVAKATGIRVVLLDSPPEPAAEPEHVCCPPGSATISTRDDGSFCPPDNPAPATPRCVAHGNAHCAQCSLNPADCGSPTDRPGCGAYLTDGMHWDTCPNRVQRVLDNGDWQMGTGKVIPLNDPTRVERNTQPDEQAAAEPCPSLYLRGTVLYACTAHDNDKAAPHRTSGTEWSWTDQDAVPVPWPIDQEPPPGIDTLHDPAEIRQDHMPYLRRAGGGWSWWSDPTSKVTLDQPALTWEAAERQAAGDLYVVRPT